MTSAERKTIERLIAILKTRYQHDASGHDWLHLERVWRNANMLARGEKVDRFLIEMASLLHDVDDYKFRKDGDDELSGTKALLDDIGVIGEQRRHILNIISNVSYKGADVPVIEETLEGKIVQDADRLDAMGAIGIARVFAYGGSAGHPYYDPHIKPVLAKTFEEYKTRKKTTINHFYDKLLLLKDRMNTPQAKKIAEHRHKYLEIFLREFFSEIQEKT